MIIQLWFPGIMVIQLWFPVNFQNSDSDCVIQFQYHHCQIAVFQRPDRWGQLTIGPVLHPVEEERVICFDVVRSLTADRCEMSQLYSQQKKKAAIWAYLGTSEMLSHFRLRYHWLWLLRFIYVSCVWCKHMLNSIWIGWLLPFHNQFIWIFHIVSSKKLPSPNLSPFRTTVVAPWHLCLLDSQTKEGALVFACVRQLLLVCVVDGTLEANM